MRMFNRDWHFILSALAKKERLKPSCPTMQHISLKPSSLISYCLDLCHCAIESDQRFAKLIITTQRTYEPS